MAQKISLRRVDRNLYEATSPSGALVARLTATRTTCDVIREYTVDHVDVPAAAVFRVGEYGGNPQRARAAAERWVFEVGAP